MQFRWSSAVQTVCPFCKSILVRNDLVLENLGKVAEIMSHYDVVNVAVGALTPEPEKKRRKK